MNQDFEDIRRAILHLINDVAPNNPETISHAITQYIISLDESKRFKAGMREPRIRIPPEERTDGWKERVQRNWRSSNDEEIGR